MSQPRSVRLEDDVLERLAGFAARRPGLSSASALALLVDEGLRMDAHPGIVFREGPSGRRAGVVDGPDVWEIIRAVRSVREAEPAVVGDAVLTLVEESTGLPRRAVQVAVDYYAQFAADIDCEIDEASRVERVLLESLERHRQLLGS